MYIYAQKSQKKYAFTWKYKIINELRVNKIKHTLIEEKYNLKMLN